MKKILLYGVLIIVLCSKIYSQDYINKNKIFEQAVLDFNARNFEDANSNLVKLLQSNPNEPRYLYYSARCLIEMNQNLNKADEYLRLTIPYDIFPDAHFYLGRVYHLTYRFNDAVEAYRNYLSQRIAININKELVERNIETAKNGQGFIENSYELDVISKKMIAINELEKEFKSPIGRLISKPREFYSKYENKINDKHLIFLPKKTKSYDYIYFAGYTDKGKGGKQIFRVKNINDQTWSIPEELGNEINSKYDEDYSYYETETATLYYSSKGHNSMGGYDIFSSTYDWNKKQWSQPKNMGFPVNSPFDDYLFIPDKLNKRALLCSKRSTDNNHVIIYEILIKDTMPDNSYSYNEIVSTANLDVNINEGNLIEYYELSKEKTILKNWNNKLEEEYNMIIAEALDFQEVADSISDLIKENRIQLKNTNNNIEKSRISNIIVSLMHDQQKMQTFADDKYYKAEMLKGKYFKENIKVTDESSKEFTINNTSTTDTILKYSEKEEAGREFTDENSKKTNDDDENNSMIFKIMDNPPYNNENPIPINIDLPDKLIYRIQLGAFSIPKSQDFYKGLYPLSCETQNTESVTKYYTGFFNTLKNAKAALEQVKEYGFPDAFIVAFFNKKKIDIEKAIEIEYKNNY